MGATSSSAAGLISMFKASSALFPAGAKKQTTSSPRSEALLPALEGEMLVKAVRCTVQRARAGREQVSFWKPESRGWEDPGDRTLSCERFVR